MSGSTTDKDAETAKAEWKAFARGTAAQIQEAPLRPLPAWVGPLRASRLARALAGAPRRARGAWARATLGLAGRAGDLGAAAAIAAALIVAQLLAFQAFRAASLAESDWIVLPKSSFGGPWATLAERRLDTGEICWANGLENAADPSGPRFASENCLQSAKSAPGLRAAASASEAGPGSRRGAGARRVRISWGQALLWSLAGRVPKAFAEAGAPQASVFLSAGNESWGFFAILLLFGIATTLNAMTSLAWSRKKGWPWRHNAWARSLQPGMMARPFMRGAKIGAGIGLAVGLVGCGEGVRLWGLPWALADAGMGAALMAFSGALFGWAQSVTATGGAEEDVARMRAAIALGAVLIERDAIRRATGRAGASRAPLAASAAGLDAAAGSSCAGVVEAKNGASMKPRRL
jgi:hypothetical protein